MPTDIASLSPVALDYTRQGPGLMLGYSRALSALDKTRTGFLLLDTVFSSGRVPVIMRCEDLYLIGFQSSDGWWRFSDADWPLVPGATSLGFDGQYGNLGGLTGSIRADALQGAGKLSDAGTRRDWKKHLRTLIVVVAENLRLVPVNMNVLGVLNGIQDGIDLVALEPYIRNWGKASQGMDMSVQAGPNLRTGFRDPTLVRR